MKRHSLLLLAVALLAITALVGSAFAGPPPKRLDRNLGWVLSHPHVHNLFWHASWDSNNPLFTRTQLNTFTATLVSNGYLNGASQYGVGSPSDEGWDRPSSICGRRTPPTTISSARVLAWVTCEVITPGTGVPYPSARSPISNDVYIVYLPKSTTISDNLSIPKFKILGHTFGPWVLYVKKACTDYDGYHSLSFGGTSLFAYAVIATHCATSLDDVTTLVSHEIVEAATDPIPTAGWIDNSIGLSPPGFRRLLEGETADICSSSGAVPSPAVKKGSYWFVPYWSNRLNTCVAG